MWEKFDATKEVFVYGAQIDDFHTLDKNYLGIICMGGIQELSKRNDSLTTQVTTLQTNNDLLTNNLIAQQQTITQMQEQITTLMQQMASLLQK